MAYKDFTDIDSAWESFQEGVMALKVLPDSEVAAIKAVFRAGFTAATFVIARALASDDAEEVIRILETTGEFYVTRNSSKDTRDSGSTGEGGPESGGRA